MGKQTTLFESWSNRPKKQPSHQAPTSKVSEFVDLCDSDDPCDEAFLAALEQSEQQYYNTNGSTPAAPPNNKANNNVRSHASSRVNGNSDLATENVPVDWNAIQHIPGFDKEAGTMWIYPTNYPVREYQLNIVTQALFQNTLVVLPTGLGKTFIAAVIMYNFYRWYPRGKVVFMAPTKPLVAQQIEACYNIMGIPQSDTAEMTGMCFSFRPHHRLLALFAPNFQSREQCGKRTFG